MTLTSKPGREGEGEFFFFEPPLAAAMYRPVAPGYVATLGARLRSLLLGQRGTRGSRHTVGSGGDAKFAVLACSWR